MLEVLAFSIVTGIMPVVINKSTEGSFHWLKPYLSEVWMAIFVFFSIYLLLKPEATEIIMKIHPRLPGVLGYAVCGVLGATLLCGYWWLTGKMLSTKSPPVHGTLTADQIEAITRVVMEIQKNHSMVENRVLKQTTFDLVQQLRDYQVRFTKAHYDFMHGKGDYPTEASAAWSKYLDEQHPARLWSTKSAGNGHEGCSFVSPWKKRLCAGMWRSAQLAGSLAFGPS